MTQEIKSFNLLLDEGFNKAAWHGPNLLGSLRGITIPELADAMGIKQNYLYRVMPGLAEEGKVTKSGRGWHLRN